MVTRKQPEEPIIRPDCRTRRGLELIADQWSMLVVVALDEKTKRFSQLHAQIAGISKKMLTQVLRELERNGLVKVGDGPLVLVARAVSHPALAVEPCQY